MHRYNYPQNDHFGAFLLLVCYSISLLIICSLKKVLLRFFFRKDLEVSDIRRIFALVIANKTL